MNKRQRVIPMEGGDWMSLTNQHEQQRNSKEDLPEASGHSHFGRVLEGGLTAEKLSHNATEVIFHKTL